MGIYHLQTAIDGQHSYRIVTLLDDQLIGTLDVTDILTDHPCLVSIYVHPDYRRRNVTWNMICKAIDLLHAYGHNKVVLIAKDENEPAVKCYEKLGFERYADKPDLPGFGCYVRYFKQQD